MTLLVTGVGNVGLTLQRLSGYAGGVRRVVATLEVASRPLANEDMVILALTAEVAVACGGGSPRSLGVTRFSCPVALNSVARPTVDLAVDLTDGQVEQIEALRQGGGLDLVLDVAGVAHHSGNHADPVAGAF